jgi:hypothetical protein
MALTEQTYSSNMQFWLFLALFLSFAIKMPIVPPCEGDQFGNIHSFIFKELFGFGSGKNYSHSIVPGGLELMS